MITDEPPVTENQAVREKERLCAYFASSSSFAYLIFFSLAVFLLRLFYLWQKNNYFNYAFTQDSQQH